MVAKKKPRRSLLQEIDEADGAEGEGEEEKERKGKENEEEKAKLNRTSTLARSRRRMKEVSRNASGFRRH